MDGLVSIRNKSNRTVRGLIIAQRLEGVLLCVCVFLARVMKECESCEYRQRVYMCVFVCMWFSGAWKRAVCL